MVSFWLELTGSAKQTGFHGAEFSRLSNNRRGLPVALWHWVGDAMVAGGSEALCVSQAVVFDLLYATSIKNDTPTQTPSPFDRDRDGLVIGEGGCTLVLESLESAQRRGAPILAEIVGYGASSDGGHATRPNQDMMAAAMRLALRDAGVSAQDIGFVCAHGTATDHGDHDHVVATTTTNFGLCFLSASFQNRELSNSLHAVGTFDWH